MSAVLYRAPYDGTRRWFEQALATACRHLRLDPERAAWLKSGIAGVVRIQLEGGTRTECDALRCALTEIAPYLEVVVVGRLGFTVKGA